MGLLDELWAQGEPYRAAIGGLLSGDVEPAKQVLGVGKPWPKTVDREQMKQQAYQMAMDWNNPIGLLGMVGAKGLSKAGEIADNVPMKSSYKGLPEGPKYQIEHKPMTVEGGAAELHDLARVFGDDVYGPNALQYFGSGGYAKQEKEALKIMRQVKGKPEAKITVYRGVPDGVDKINPGDWVTLSPDAAAEYGNVLSMEVPASYITSWPDSLLEYGYFPKK